VRRHKGRPLAAGAFAELDALNRLLERDETYNRIAPRGAGRGFQLQTVRRWRHPDALLLPWARHSLDSSPTEDFSG
jgi:hypothetical protein